MGIGINIAGTGIGLTQTIMNQKNKQTGQYDEVIGRRRKPDSLQTGGF